MRREELLEMYHRARVFLFPSHEGAGMVVAEAMSHGVPVVCLDNAGPGELVAPGSELRVSEEDYERMVLELSIRLMRLYSDPVFYGAEKELARDRWMSHLWWNRRSGQLREIYASLLK
jgi:glycosyltransferase involved in cell wall biosynthesis